VNNAPTNYQNYTFNELTKISKSELYHYSNYRNVVKNETELLWLIPYSRESARCADRTNQPTQQGICLL
jgi:hypothetical protein